MYHTIEYYEFPNGEIVKRVNSDAVYRFCKTGKRWEIDYSLTATFAWDRPMGNPCENLRQKADISCDLPPFPAADAFKPGHTVVFGAYPQKSLHDFSPIEWVVLETDGSTALCLSKKCLLPTCYCDPETAYATPELLWYEKSLARQICNTHFYDTAFSDIEKARIIPRKISDTHFGAQCIDPVFLLSEREVLQHFPETPQRMSEPTFYAIQKGAQPNLASWWILPEENAYGIADGSIYPKAVLPSGYIQFHGRNIYHSDFTIRPCVQIKYASER